MWLEESQELREIHKRLNSDLMKRFSIPNSGPAFTRDFPSLCSNNEFIDYIEEGALAEWLRKQFTLFINPYLETKK